jgi:hypothetical protein
MATFTNTPKTSSSITNTSKTVAGDAFQLLIDGTYFLLIDNTYKLNIQSATGVITNVAKN